MAVYYEQFSKNWDLNSNILPTQMYMIASTPRCGSHMLGHAMIHSGELGVPLEYLQAQNLSEWKRLYACTSAKEVFQNLFTRRTSKNGCFGFKAHWSQFTGFHKRGLFLTLPPINKVIWIYRRDLLAQAISYETANQTGQWISSVEAAKTPKYNYKKTVRAAEIIRNSNSQWKRLIEFGYVESKVVAYEDLLASTNEVLTDVAYFVDSNVSKLPKLSNKTERQISPISQEWKTQFINEAKSDDLWVLEKQWFDN